MKIAINNIEYILDEHHTEMLLSQFREMLLDEYEKMDPKWKLLLTGGAREILRFAETKIRKLGNEQEAMLWRPEKGVSAPIHVSKMGTKLLAGGSKNATIQIDTDSDAGETCRSITAIKFIADSSQSG